MREALAFLEGLTRWSCSRWCRCFCAPSAHEGIIGQGSFSTVTLERVNGSWMAVKRIKNSNSRTYEEARLHGRASGHPNVIHLYSAYVVDGCMRLHMEFGGWDTLFETTDKGLFRGDSPRLSIWSVFAQICDALVHIHNLSIAHRDVKPDNVVVDWRGTPRLTDFGLATEQTLSSVRGAVGTESFCAPEVLEEDHYCGFKADVWSLGVTYLSCATGLLPFYRACVDCRRYSNFCATSASMDSFSALNRAYSPSKDTFLLSWEGASVVDSTLCVDASRRKSMHFLQKLFQSHVISTQDQSLSGSRD